MTCRAWLRGCLLIVMLLGMAACDRLPPPPKTYPVKGKVVFVEGGSPTEGDIEFKSATEPFVAKGRIQADGSFTLETLASNTKVAGAVEGEHTVTFISGVGKEQGQSSLTPSQASEKYKVKDRKSTRLNS